MYLIVKALFQSMVVHKPHYQIYSRYADKEEEKEDKNWYKHDIAAESIIKNKLTAPESHKVKMLFELEKLKYVKL